MMRYLIFVCFICLLGCNPFPKKDAHPEVPLLNNLLKDKTKFKKIVGMDGLSEILVLKSDRLLLTPNNSNLTFKIIDVNNKLVIEKKFDWKLPFYVDRAGNLYFDRAKYYFPDYNKSEPFKTVVVQDSLDKKSEDLQNLTDSLRWKAVDKYEISLLKQYGLQKCENSIANTAGCDVFKIINNTLVVRQTELFKNEFEKTKTSVPKFDKDILIGWKNGKLPSPDYLAYYQFGDLKFKCDDMTHPTTVEIAGKKYLHLPSDGLYQIL